MKHIFSFAIIAALVAFTLSSCVIRVKQTNEDTVEKTYDLKDFQSVDITGSANVIYIPGDKYSVKVKATESALELLQLEVHDSILVISQKEKIRMDNFDSDDDDCPIWHFNTGDVNMSNVTVYVTAPSLIDVFINGSGSFNCNDTITTDSLHLIIYGSGDMNISKVNAGNIQAQISGAGDIKLNSVTGNRSSYFLIGSGNIIADEVNTDESEVNLAGSGNITIGYKDSKNSYAILSGSGDIILKGTLDSLTMENSGAGSLDVNQLKAKNIIETSEEE